MQAAELHPQESERLRMVARLDSLIREGDQRLEELTHLASRICDAPLSVVCLVDFDQQYFVARTGVDALGTPREQAMCAHTIIEGDLVEVRDASVDPRFMGNPLVTGGPKIRHYAGVKVFGRGNLPVGTLAVFGSTPRNLSEPQREMLRVLGRQASTLIQLRSQVEATAPGSRAASAGQLEIVHDLRVPLQCLAKLLEQLHSDSEPELVQTVHRSALQLAELADRLLMVSGSSEAIKDDQNIVVADFVDEVATQMRPLLQEGVVLRVTLEAEAPEVVQVSRTVLYRVVTNLLSNAIRYTSTGHIEILVSKAQDHVRLSVLDSGSGISPELQAGLRDPLGVALAVDGHGLGLGIARDLTAELGGTMDFKSSPGEGSHFWIELPIHPPHASSGAAPVRVLVAEDVEVNRLLADQFLQMAGFDVVTVEDGVQVQQQIVSNDFDVVLLDCWMPGPTGPDVTRRLRDTLGTGVVILGYTGTSEAHIEGRFLRAGADGVVSKPLCPEDLQLIRRLVGERRQRA
jgi:signal transduction histidine kinase